MELTSTHDARKKSEGKRASTRSKQKVGGKKGIGGRNKNTNHKPGLRVSEGCGNVY
jgi:hypothetical protein